MIPGNSYNYTNIYYNHKSLITFVLLCFMISNNVLGGEDEIRGGYRSENGEEPRLRVHHNWERVYF